MIKSTMHAKPTLVVLLLGIFTAVSAAKAQPPAAVTSGADGARGQATAPSPAAGKALVYVYRPLAHGSVVFSGAKLLRYAQVFVNGDFLAELENSSYASIQAPQVPWPSALGGISHHGPVIPVDRYRPRRY